MAQDPIKLPTIETRNMAGVEYRDDAEGGGSRIVGEFIKYNVLSDDLGGFREQIAPGAFTESVAEDDIRARYEHENRFIMGRKSAATLVLRETQTGVNATIFPPPTQWAKDLIESIRRRDVNEASFAFRAGSNAEDQTWDFTDPQVALRTVRKGRLKDIAIVAFPAYPQTRVSVRMAAIASRLESKQPLSDLELRFIQNHITDLQQQIALEPEHENSESLDLLKRQLDLAALEEEVIK